MKIISGAKTKVTMDGKEIGFADTIHSYEVYEGPFEEKWEPIEVVPVDYNGLTYSGEFKVSHWSFSPGWWKACAEDNDLWLCWGGLAPKYWHRRRRWMKKKLVRPSYTITYCDEHGDPVMFEGPVRFVTTEIVE